MQKDISKTIVFVFSNKFTKQKILEVSMPYIPFLASKGHYSRLWKQFKSSVAIGFEKSLVSGKYLFKYEKSKRTIFTLPSKVELNMPYDVTAKDVEIILYHIKGIKMSL